jgi:hypothetical protein
LKSHGRAVAHFGRPGRRRECGCRDTSSERREVAKTARTQNNQMQWFLGEDTTKTKMKLKLKRK